MFERCHHGTAIKQQFEEIFATFKRQGCLKSLFAKLTNWFLHGFLMPFKGLKTIYLNSFSQRMSTCPFVSQNIPCRILWLFSIPMKSPRSEKSQMLGFEFCYILSTVHQKQSSVNSHIGVYGSNEGFGSKYISGPEAKECFLQSWKVKDIYRYTKCIHTHGAVLILVKSKEVSQWFLLHFQSSYLSVRWQSSRDSVSKLNLTTHFFLNVLVHAYVPKTTRKIKRHTSNFPAVLHSSIQTLMRSEQIKGGEERRKETH